MRIGIDASCWANARGYGRYARELIRAMVRSYPDDEFVFFLDQRSLEVFHLDRPNVRTVLVEQSASPTRAAVTGSSRSPRDMLRFSRATRREELDVFFSPSVYTYFPLPLRLPALVAIHDAIAERFPEKTLPTFKDRFFWRLKVGLALRQATLILTVSDYAKGEIVRELDQPSDRIRVAKEAPASTFRPESDPNAVAEAARQHGIPEGAAWFVYVGGFNPHKNLPRVVRAVARLRREGDPGSAHLLLVGSRGREGFHGEVDLIDANIAEEGMGDRIHWAGYVPDEELRVLLSGAAGLLIVSESECFGLTGVEAAECGCPVVATTESPLPSLLEGGGWFVDPGDEEGLVAAMRHALSDPAEGRRRGAVALERVGVLSWPRSAEAVMAALHEVARS